MTPLQQLNQQPPENRITTDRSGKTLEVHSIFSTIQGEGPFTGDKAVFIRLAGCNLRCYNCDTDYTSRRTVMAIENIIDEAVRVYSYRKPCLAKKPARPLVVITGGEPFRQNISGLVKGLIQKELFPQIETNGTYDLGGWSTGHDWQNVEWKEMTIVCSPKTEKISPQMPIYADFYKYVLSHDGVCPEDGLPTKVLGKNVRPFRPTLCERPIYLQPEDSKNPETNRLNVEAVKKSCMTYGYRMGFQLHKLIGVD